MKDVGKEDGQQCIQDGNEYKPDIAERGCEVRCTRGKLDSAVSSRLSVPTGSSTERTTVSVQDRWR